MFFRPKPSLPFITLYADGQEIYKGLLSEIPLKENMILSKSIQFFDDPEPCHIHRRAVRVRLTEEILSECVRDRISPPGPELLACADVPQIDAYLLSMQAPSSKNQK